MRCPTLAELPPPPPGKTGWPWTEESEQLPNRMPDGEPWPKVSIVTPSYNQGQFIEETIRSVLLQGYPNLEYIIIDGGSDDGSVQIIRRYEPWLGRWISERDRGQSDAITKGWKSSRGKVLAWLNADDSYCPDALGRVSEAFYRQDDIAVVSGQCHITDESGSVIYTKAPGDFDPSDMLEKSGGVPGQPAVFIGCGVFDKLGGPRDDLHYVMDWELWIRIGLSYSLESVSRLSVPLANSREWARTKTRTGGRRICEEHRAVMKEVFRNEPQLRRIRNRSYGATFWKQAHLLLAVGQRSEARRSLVQALRLAPIHTLRLTANRYSGIGACRVGAELLIPELILEAVRELRKSLVAA